VLNRNYYKIGPIVAFKAAEGSFTDIRSANDFVNRTLEADPTTLGQVSRGEILDKITIEHRFGYRTGTEAFRPDGSSDAYIRPTYNVRTIIIHDPNTSKGFRLITAFPFNDRPDE